MPAAGLLTANHGAYRQPKTIGPVSLPTSGVIRRALGIGALALAPLFLVASLFERELAGAVYAAVLAATGIGFHCWGKRSLEARRTAIRERMELSLHQFAAERGGRLTVTDVATGLNLSFAEAERELSSLEDDQRVRSQVSARGIIYYEFPEIIHGDELEPAPGLAIDGDLKQ